jgi:penicillin amidase/acyl-homoserine-lactone acylase
MSRLTTLISIIALTTLLFIGLLGYCLWPRPPDLSHLANIGEKYDVEILRDTWGVPHIYGKTDADAAFGLAYAHAEDDFVTIQETLLTARGELASVFGSSAATGDYLVNQLRVWDVVEAGYDTDLSPETKAIVEAYADGVNLFAALHTDQVLSPDLFPVTGKDIVAYSVLQLPLFYGLDAVLTELITNPQTADISARNTSFNNFDTDLVPRPSASPHSALWMGLLSWQ